jgi:hypothetical protein
MTPYELESETAETSPYFFTPNNMKFAGDTMSNYGCRSTTIPGHEGPVWELYRKRPVKCGLKTSAYFDTATFRQVWPRAPLSE